MGFYEMGYTISHRGSPHQGKTTSLDTGGQLFQNLLVVWIFAPGPLFASKLFLSDDLSKSNSEI